MSELKPCPFCGRIPIVDNCGDNRFFVRCKCGIAQDKLYGQRCNAVRRWNARRQQPEQKKGKWIVHPEVKNVYGGTYIECSQCGEKYVVRHMEDEKYCRNCGAKMEREQKHLGNKSDLVILDEVKYE